jgi:hypothetical protein
MEIKTAQYIKEGITNENSVIKIVTQEDEILFVPLDTANKHYVEILKQVADGTITIAEAD